MSRSLCSYGRFASAALYARVLGLVNRIGAVQGQLSAAFAATEACLLFPMIALIPE